VAPTNRFFEDFAEVYLINLPERTDRLKAVRRELSRIGWNLGRNGVKVFPARRFTDRGTFPNVGARGTFFSHLGCLEDAHGRSSKNVLLLEDDIAFTSSLPLLMDSVLNQLNSRSWDFCYLGHEQTGSILNANRSTRTVKLVPHRGDIIQSHFLLINRRVVGRLISHLRRVAAGTEGDQEYGPMPVDGAYNILRRGIDVETLIADPKLGWQRPSRSDITPKRFDSWRALRPAVSAIRDVRYVISRWRS